MDRKSLLVRFGLFVLFITISFSCDVNNAEQENFTRELSQAEKKLVKADQSFSLNVFKEVVASDSSENIFISPLSISMALGMTMNGAKEDTYTEMKQTLAYGDIELSEINEGYKSLIELLTTVDPKVTMEIANSTWSRQGFAVEQDFSASLKEYFDAEAHEMDFSDPATTDIINGWVSDKTHQKIAKILSSIPSDAIMYLINAVYFKGDWVYEFDPEKTSERNFKTEQGENVTVEMMNQQHHFPFYISDEVQMIDLPYGDSLFTMSILLPGNADTPIEEFIGNSLTQQNLDNWYQNLSVSEVGIILPKLELEYKLGMNKVLKAMGMQKAFAPAEADFTGINKNGGLFITQVLHKTYLKMDEEGTEAAGVTAVEIGITSIGAGSIPVITVDRPYVMVLREQSSGTILFMGKVGNPKTD